MTPMTTQISEASAGLPFDPDFRAATVPRTAMSIEPRATATGTPAGRTDGAWPGAAGVGAPFPRWPSLASTRLSISAPIRPLGLRPALLRIQARVRGAPPLWLQCLPTPLGFVTCGGPA